MRKKNTSDVVEVLEKKFELSKALAEIRANISREQDKRKVDYITYLYVLKQKYSDKLYEQSMTRLKYLHESGRKRK